MKRVLIADDHIVTRRGVREILREAFPGVETEEVGDVAGVIQAVSGGAWDLILLDVRMPGGTVIETLTAIRAGQPTTPILILTALVEVAHVVETMRAGANGVIHKHRAPEDLVDAIAQVADGGVYLHPESAAAVARYVQAPPAPESLHSRLSVRELEVLRLVALGRAVKEVAGDLGLSDKTVATYLARIREKTGMNSHVEIARYAIRCGLVDADSDAT